MQFNDHKYIAIPQSYKEKRDSLFSVRHFHRSVIVNNNDRYYDYETDKLCTDKLKTINSYTLNDIIDDCHHNGLIYGNYDRHYRRPKKQLNSPPLILPVVAFFPKDNEFDEECKKDEEIHITEIIPTETDDPLVKNVQQLLKEKEEKSYQNRVRMTDKLSKMTSNIMKNVWIVKK